MARDEVEMKERRVAVYETPDEDEVMERDTVEREPIIYQTGPTRDIDMAVVTPVDRIRWGPIIAGLFAALSTLVVLNVLGLAIGLSTYNPGDLGESLGLSAGLWGIISTLLAFVIGGWLAARTAAIPGRMNGTLNGLMVWMVTIPLMLWLIGASIGSVLGMAGGLVTTGAEVVAPIAENLVGETVIEGELLDETGAGGIVGDVSGQDIEQAAEAAGTTAWGVLFALVVGLAAAALGGLLGSRPAVQTLGSTRL